MRGTVGGWEVEQLKTYPTIGVCGLDCGLCPRYYTVGPSRCPGCGGSGFSDKHPSCSFITCCVKKKGLEVCGLCPEFPCPKFKSEEEYRQVALSSSYPPSRNVLSNLRFIREKRIGLLETMIEGYDDGRSRSFFCRGAALLEVRALESSLDEAKKSMRAGGSRTGDTVNKTKVLRGILEAAALHEGIELTRKK